MNLAPNLLPTPLSHPVDRPIAWGLALLKLLIHLPFLERYGYHHDELYFLACGQHLAFGYVDHAPLVPWLARLADELTGGALWSLRSISLLAGVATVLLVVRLAARLGGGRFAQLLAGLAVVLGPAFLRMAGVLHLPPLEILFWTLVVDLVVRLLEEEKPRLWLAVGLVAGLGLLNKHTMALVGFGLVVGLLATRERRHFASRWLWMGGGLALLLFLPNLVWQAANGWPTWVFLTHQRAEVAAEISRWQFVAGQLIYPGVTAAFVWIAGLVFLFRAQSGRYRVIGWIWLAMFLVLLATGSKIYYLTPIYPALFAAGGVAVEAFTRPIGRRWLRPASLVVVLAGGLAQLPLFVPVLSLAATERAFAVATGGSFDNVYELTGDLRGMLGWEERVEAVARAWNRLSEEEQANAPILTSWYGPAGAIDFFGRGHGLPRAISGHMSYHLWGPPDRPFEVAIAADLSREFLDQHCGEVEPLETLEFPQSNPGDRFWPVALCRHPKVDFAADWERYKDWGW